MTIPGAPNPRMHLNSILDKIRQMKADIRKLQVFNRRIRMDSGSQAITPSAINVVTTVSVTFNKTFENAPNVVCQFITGVSSTATCFVWPTAITTTGFTLNINRSTTTTTTVLWIAADPVVI